MLGPISLWHFSHYRIQLDFTTKIIWILELDHNCFIKVGSLSFTKHVFTFFANVNVAKAVAMNVNMCIDYALRCSWRMHQKMLIGDARKTS